MSGNGEIKLMNFEDTQRLLSGVGRLIASIPNVRYYKVLRELVFKGNWKYEDAGILNRTHLRFFTLKTITDMFEKSGYEIMRMIKEPSCGLLKKTVNKLLGNLLIDFLVVQYKFVARPKSASGARI